MTFWRFDKVFFFGYSLVIPPFTDVWQPPLLYHDLQGGTAEKTPSSGDPLGDWKSWIMFQGGSDRADRVQEIREFLGKKKCDWDIGRRYSLKRMIWKLQLLILGSIGVMGRWAFFFGGSEFRVVKSNLVVLLGIPPEFFQCWLETPGKLTWNWEKLELFRVFLFFPMKLKANPSLCGGTVATEEAGWIPGKIGLSQTGT